MKNHDELVEQARDSIDAVFGDSSVTREETIDALGELIGHAQMLVSALFEDAQRLEDTDDHGP